MVGSTSKAISNAVVSLLHDYTGRGPTSVRTTISHDVVTVVMRDCLTKAERTLAERGKANEVLAMRRSIQEAMREELSAIVEAQLGREVQAFLSDNLYEPDIAVEIFVMAPAD